MDSSRKPHVDLRKTLFLLPSLITLSSIFCGFKSVLVSAHAQGEEDYHRAALLIVFAMFFDILDGRVARMTKTQSAFGLQIDSIADVVSFGVAPAVLVYEWSLHRFGGVGLAASFIFCAAGAVRLARFNVLSMNTEGRPQKPSKYIVGLPIPGAAGILVGLVVANHAVDGVIADARYAGVILGITLGLAALMVSTVQFRSFTELRFNVATVGFLTFVAATSAAVASRYKPGFVLLWLLACYVILALGESLVTWPSREKARLAAKAELVRPRTSQPPPPRL